MSGIPAPIKADFDRARRLEWWTLAWMGSVVAVMYFASGGSQAMRSALIEDVLSLVPAVTWLIAARFEPREPTEKYPFGFVRVQSLAFLVSAVALTVVGAFVLYESARTLIAAEHATVPPVTLFGQDIWFGWLMIAALAYSVVVPLVLGHKKLPIAERMRDKVLHTDALMQKADWQTGLAGIAGITGIFFGLWWADSAAAMFIGLSILRDGLTNMVTAAAELLDGAPRELEGHAIAGDAQRLEKHLSERWPGARIRLRESGRYIFATVEGVEPAEVPLAGELMGGDPAWRLGRVDFCPAGCGKIPGQHAD